MYPYGTELYVLENIQLSIQYMNIRSNSTQISITTYLSLLSLIFIPNKTMSETNNLKIANELLATNPKERLKRVIPLYCDGNMTIYKDGFYSLVVGRASDEYITPESIAMDIERCGHGTNGFLIGLEKNTEKEERNKQYMENIQKGDYHVIKPKDNRTNKEKTTGQRNHLMEAYGELLRKEEEQKFKREMDTKEFMLEYELNKTKESIKALKKSSKCDEARKRQKEYEELAPQFYTPQYRNEYRQKAQIEKDWIRRNCPM